MRGTAAAEGVGAGPSPREDPEPTWRGDMWGGVRREVKSSFLLPEFLGCSSADRPARCCAREESRPPGQPGVTSYLVSVLNGLPRGGNVLTVTKSRGVARE